MLLPLVLVTEARRAQQDHFASWLVLINLHQPGSYTSSDSRRDPISSNLTHWLVVVDTLISTLIFMLMTFLIILVIITIPITILPIIL